MKLMSKVKAWFNFFGSKDPVKCEWKPNPLKTLSDSIIDNRKSINRLRSQNAALERRLWFLENHSAEETLKEVESNLNYTEASQLTESLREMAMKNSWAIHTATQQNENNLEKCSICGEMKILMKTQPICDCCY